MAMGFSTQRGSFKPYLPSPFRPSPPPPPWRSVSTTTKAYSSSHPFCRPELHLPLSANSSCSKIAVFKCSFQSKRGSCYSARTSTIMDGRTLSVHGQGSPMRQMNEQKWHDEIQKLREQKCKDTHHFGSLVTSADTTLAKNGSTQILESQNTTKHVMDNEPGLRSGNGTIAASSQCVPKMDSLSRTGSSVEEFERINKSNGSLSLGERMKKSNVKISKSIEENMDKRIPSKEKTNGTIAASNQCVPKMDSLSRTGSSVEEFERINKSNGSLSLGERMKKSNVKISKSIEENMDKRIPSKEKTNGTIAASNQCVPKMDSSRQTGSSVEEFERINKSNGSLSLGERMKKSNVKISKPIEENMDKRIPSKEKTNGTIAASNQCFPKMDSSRQTGSSVEEFERINKSNDSLSLGKRMKKSNVKISKPIEENMDKRIPSKGKTNGTIAASNQCFPKMDSSRQTGSSVEEFERINKSNDSLSLGERMKKSNVKISKSIEENMDKRIPSKEKTNGTIAASNQCFPKMDSSRQTGSSVEEFERINKSNDSLSLVERMKKSTEKISKSIEENMDKRIPSREKTNAVSGELNETRIEPINTGYVGEHCERLSRLYDKVLVVDNITMAKKIVGLLTTEYKHLVWGCDTEVAKIEVRHETPVDHGELICFSIYCGPEVDFGGGKSYIWVDVLDGGGRDILMEFAPFFEDPLIKKVWHNYSFDSHIIENYGIKMSGFHADTMHMARLWDSSRKLAGGYSLEALTSDKRVMSGGENKTLAGGSNKKKTFTEGETLIGKISMKTIFGKKKTKKDGTEGKIIKIPPVEEIQREERILWICYSALDSISTLKLFESLKEKLIDMKWNLDGENKGTMYDFYEEYWRPFGELLVKMETEGMLVDKAYLAEVEKVATVEQQIAGNRFRNWASAQCPDALYMNVGSDAQLRQLFFGGIQNIKDINESLPTKRIFKVPNVDKVIEDGKKVAAKFRNITLCKIGDAMETDMYTDSGWPKVSGDVLKTLAGKVSAEYDWTEDDYEFQPDNEDKPPPSEKQIDTSSYGTAYAAFGGDKKGIEACHAIAALCEVCSIDSLLSNFIRPLQHSQISGKNGRIHCSLNINTETGRLSARRPNLQNQPALEKDRYKIRQAFIAAPGNSLVVADYGQLELRILAHLANCQSMLDAFKTGGDFHSRTAMNMYSHIRDAVENKEVLLEWHPQPGEEKPPVPLLKDAFPSERKKAKELNFSIAYGKTPTGLARDWKVSVKEAKETVYLWYKARQEVRKWQEARKQEARDYGRVHTLLGRARLFPKMQYASNSMKGHIERAAINTPVQGSAADVAMCAMLEITRNARLKELGWRLLLQVHDEVILEGPTESAEEAKAIVVDCMSKPFYGTNFLKVDLSVDAKFEQNWYAAK